MQSKIYIVQDCDADGLFSSALAYKFLRLIIDTERIKILYHSDKGHGLTPEIMDQIEADSFVWLPDAGTNDIDQCKKLYERGCKILITDHHEIEEDNPYAIVINNQRKDIENKAGSGSLVTFKFIQYCCEQFKIKDYLNWIDLVVFANIGDMMSMTTLENRALNYLGLKNITNPFLSYLCDKLIKDEVNLISITWNVIPKINALIRGGDLSEKMMLTKALLSEEHEQTDLYDICYDILMSLHKTQSMYAKEKTKQILDGIDDSNNIIVAFTEKTPYTGLVANKIRGEKNKPVLLVYEKEGQYTGSCRSPFDFKDIMSKSGLFEWCRGHQKACGVSFPVENYNEIIDFFNQEGLPEPEAYKVISSYNPSELPEFLFDFTTEYSKLWGTDIPEPVIHTHFICNGMDWQELKGSVIKLYVNGVTFIKFFASKELKKQLFVGENVKISIDIIGKCCYNEWQGGKYKQVEIKEIEVHEYKIKDWSELF